MSRTALDGALAKRLEALTGEDAACCVPDLRADADAARAAGGFDAALARAKALGDEKRMLAAALLKRRGELCACEIQVALDLTHATVSHHMKQLATAGIVVGEKRGKWLHYALTPEAIPFIP